MDTRKKVSFSLAPDVVERLKEAAKADGRNASRYLEALLFNFFKMKPKAPEPPKKPTM